MTECRFTLPAGVALRTFAAARRSQPFSQGDRADRVFVVEAGSVALTRLAPSGKEIATGYLGEGDLFGEDALFGNPAYLTTATCVRASRLCVGSALAVRAVAQRDPVFAFAVARSLGARVHRSIATLEELAYATVDERLMAFFGRLAVSDGMAGPDGVAVPVELTRAELAVQIGSTRETVSARMAALERARRLRLEGQLVVVLTKEACR